MESGTQTIIAIIIVKCLSKHLQLRHSLLIALINLPTEQLLRFLPQGEENDNSQKRLGRQPPENPALGHGHLCIRREACFC